MSDLTKIKREISDFTKINIDNFTKMIYFKRKKEVCL